MDYLDIDPEADICMQEAYCEVDLGMTLVKRGENRMDQREKLNYDPISPESELIIGQVLEGNGFSVLFHTEERGSGLCIPI